MIGNHITDYETDAPIQRDRMDWRIRLAGVAAGMAVLATLGNTSPEPVEALKPSIEAISIDHYNFSFLSTPDFMNADVGNVKHSPHYRKGSPNSINDSYRRSARIVMDTFAREKNVRNVLVAGDLVEGHWGIDVDHTGTFGPTDTRKHKRKAVRNAADLYYSQWKNRFTNRGLRPLPALGDHEIGDNPWNNHSAYTKFKRHNIDVFKDAFGDAFLKKTNGGFKFDSRPDGQAHHSAYAVRIHPEVQLVSVDVFEPGKNDVRLRVDDKQMEWLDTVLTKANEDGVDWIIVQGHTPVIGPVRTYGSSGLLYEGGADSEFWKMMKKHDVDMYLCGEVHDVTAHVQDGITQISHGSLFAYGRTNYMRVDLDENKARVVVNRFSGDPDWNRDMWQTSNRRIPKSVVYKRGTRQQGAMSFTSDNQLISRSGILATYKNTS